MLDGANTIFVLRPASGRGQSEGSESEGTAGTYRLVGDCYLGQCMDGQTGVGERGSVGRWSEDDCARMMLEAEVERS